MSLLSKSVAAAGLIMLSSLKEVRDVKGANCCPFCCDLSITDAGDSNMDPLDRLSCEMTSTRRSTDDSLDSSANEEISLGPSAACNACVAQSGSKERIAETGDSISGFTEHLVDGVPIVARSVASLRMDRGEKELEPGGNEGGEQGKLSAAERPRRQEAATS